MRLGGLVCGVCVVALSAVAAAPAHADVDVTVANNAFTPATVTIFEGESVNWNFTGADKNHTVTSQAPNDQQGSFDSDPNDTGFAPPSGTFSKEFAFSGEYAYFCKVHAFMTGKVVVRDRINNPNPPPVDSVAPRFRRTRVSVRKRRVTFRLSEPALVTARLRGKMRRNFNFTGVAGRNSLKLPKLKRGRYTLTLRATDDAGNRSRRVVKRFRRR